MLKTIITATITALVVAVLALAFTPSQIGYGIETVFTTFGNGLKSIKSTVIGLDGTSLDTVLAGTCTLATSEGALEASSTDEHVCSATGVRAGDMIFARFPNRSITSAGTFHIEYAVATASDKFGVGVYNATGASTSSYPQATSSFQYFVVRPGT